MTLIVDPITKQMEINRGDRGTFRLTAEEGNFMPDDKIVFSAFTGGVSANVYQFKDTNDYYISILDLTKEESTIVDEYDTEFQSLVFRNDKGVITDAWHYAYIPYFDSQYTITVNGNKVEFQEYKGLFK